MKSAVVLGTNFVAGAGVLCYVVYRFGASAWKVLGTGPQPALLAAFFMAVLVAYLGYALRWRILLAGVGTPPSIGALVIWRAAGQCVSALLPSAKLGGEPLRVFLLARGAVAAGPAVASVVVDRVLEMGGVAPFALIYAGALLQRGVPELQGAMVTVSLGVAALALGVLLTARRLRHRGGVVTAVARSTGLDRLSFVRSRMTVLDAAEDHATRLVQQPARLVKAFTIGLAVNLIVLVEYWLLLAAFRLPHGPLAVVAAIFATGAAHSLPVPAAVGALEGAQMWLFGLLGYPPETGLAVGLAVRLREMVWSLPGLLYLAAGGALRVAPARAFAVHVSAARGNGTTTG